MKFKLFLIILLILILDGVIFFLPIDKPQNDPAIDAFPVSLPELANLKLSSQKLELGEALLKTDKYTRYHLNYQSGRLMISGIINVPKGKGKFPIVILNHGNYNISVYKNGYGLELEQDFFANNGYVVIHTDYRNFAQSSADSTNEQRLRLGYSQDILNLIEAVKKSKLKFLDKEKIVLLGHSMGGGAVLNVLAAKPELVKAAVLLAPLAGEPKNNFDPWLRLHTDDAEQIISLRGTYETNPRFWDELVPQYFFNEKTPPVMIHHGLNDETIPYQWSESLNDALKLLHRDVAFYTYADEGHVFKESWLQAMERSLEFFNQKMKN